jgi:plastocyanin
MHRKHILNLGSLVLAGIVLMGCPGDEGEGGSETASATTAASTAPAAGGLDQLTPDAGGEVIIVKMITDGTSNRFEPAEFEADKGDVIRFTLEMGVHNVHFVADSNANAQGLPTAPGDYLQLPGQTWDVKVDWQPGTYFFQCDPHAALGMVGRVKVESE